MSDHSVTIPHDFEFEVRSHKIFKNCASSSILRIENVVNFENYGLIFSYKYAISCKVYNKFLTA